MRNSPQNASSIEDGKGQGKRRKATLAHWLLLGAGAVGAIGAVARWTANASGGKLRQGASTANAADESMDNFLMAPLPQSLPAAASQSVAAPSSSLIVAADATTSPAETSVVNAPIAAAAFSAPLSPVPAESSSSQAATAKAQPGGAGRKIAGGTRKRGKMSQDFDEALAHNALPTDGREGERLNRLEHEMEANSMSAGNSDSTANSAGASAPMHPNGSPAEQALSTQAEGKMAVGEELRGREFPVPPQDTGAVSQRLVVDQETLSDEGPRSGGAVGTMPGDRQKGEMADIEDQRAITPDLVQQQR